MIPRLPEHHCKRHEKPERHHPDHYPHMVMHIAGDRSSPFFPLVASYLYTSSHSPKPGRQWTFQLSRSRNAQTLFIIWSESRAKTVTRLFRCRKSLPQILRYPQISTFSRLLLIYSCGSNIPHSDSAPGAGRFAWWGGVAVPSVSPSFSAMR